MAVSACGLRKYVWWPSPPRNVMRETARPPVAEIPKATQDFSKAYSEAIARTREAVSRGAGKEALPLWKAMEGSPWEADAIFHQGVLLQLDQDFDAAAAHYRRLAERSPVHEPAAANLLGIHLLRGDNKEAGALADRLLPAGAVPPPGMPPELAANIAAALLERGDLDRAASILLAMRTRGDYPASLSWNMAVLAYRQGNVDTARRLAAKIHPDTAALFPVAVSRFAWDREAATIPKMEKAPGAEGRMAALAGNLAAFEGYRKGNLAAAETILALRPKDAESFPEIHSNSGLVQMERGNWKDARASLERAVREKPGMPEGWINLGLFKEVYEGNASGAMECYRRYVTLNGNRKDEVLQWIEWLEKSPPQRQ
jgi:tetratricopeptide (TPR) repeat protein